MNDQLSEEEMRQALFGSAGHPRIAVGDDEGEVVATLGGHGVAQLPTWLVQTHLDEG